MQFERKPLRVHGEFFVTNYSYDPLTIAGHSSPDAPHTFPTRKGSVTALGLTPCVESKLGRPDGVR